MLTDLSLRLRVFLFFCLLGLGGAAIVLLAGYLGYMRLGSVGAPSAFVFAAVIAVLGILGMTAGIWLLFDENVAKPINKLSANLRLRAHSGIDGPVSTDEARYLGDLAPAAQALSQTMSSSVMDSAAKVAQETQRLRTETERLTALLTEIPIATILLNPAREIVLYDGQAAEVLSRIAPPRLKAPLSDYFDPEAMTKAMSELTGKTVDVPFTLKDVTGTHSFNARVKSLGGDGHMICIDTTDLPPRVAARPLVFDFDLMNTAASEALESKSLMDLCFVAFDTETTGLSVQDDTIVQLGAVRILNGRLVAGETFDTFVHPGRPIPPASTRIHRVTDADVADAPDVATAGRSFHHFARDAVLVAHNAPFDIGLLRKHAGEMGVDWTHPVLDTVLLSAVVFGTNEDHSLDALCDRLSITIPAELRHTALGDAQATGQALVTLLPLLIGKGITTFDHLVEETRKHGRLLEDLNA